MRIGLVLSKTPGYSETFFTSKIRGLQNNGVEVVLYCQTKKEDFKLCPVVEGSKVSRNLLSQVWYFLKEFLLLLPHIATVIRFAALERKDGTSIGALLKKIYLNAHILKAKLDWLHFGFATQAIGSETVAKAIGSKMAVSFRGFDINVYPIKNPDCYKNLWKHVDKVHSISRYLLDKARTMGLSEKTAFAIITPAVQLDSLPLSKAQPSLEKIKIVTIARLTWIKGLDVAIAAVGKLKEKGIKFTYYIIGEGDKNYTERYMFMVHELGLQEEVIFCGKLSHQETLEHLSAATVYLQPSLNEGFCNAVLEAQALGKLTIASNVGGLPENIVNGKTGWLYDNNSSDELANTIEMVLNLTKEQKKTISQNAQKRVREQFTIEKQQREFVGFYSEELEAKPREF
jgi:colanic acid/amylovoran biosynthesis glycosyltransferase